MLIVDPGRFTQFIYDIKMTELDFRQSTRFFDGETQIEAAYRRAGIKGDIFSKQIVLVVINPDGIAGNPNNKTQHFSLVVILRPDLIEVRHSINVIYF